MPSDEDAWSRLVADDAVTHARFRALSSVLAPLGGLLGDLLRSGIGRAHERATVRAPLPERAERVRAGQEVRLAAILHGDAPWLPPAHAAERMVHVQGRFAWHTAGLVSAETGIPTADLAPAALRRPLTGNEVERPATGRQGWLALELVDRSAEARATLLAHGADLALLGLACGWPYPALVDVELDT